MGAHAVWRLINAENESSRHHFLGTRDLITQNVIHGCICCTEVLGPLFRELVNSAPNFDHVYLTVRLTGKPASYNGRIFSRVFMGFVASYQCVPISDGLFAGAAYRAGTPAAVCVGDTAYESEYLRVQPYINFSRCREWLQICRNEHFTCGASSTNSDGAIKLIDIADHTVVHFINGRPSEYATLSYVCGPQPRVFVLGDAWVRNREGHLSHRLPKKMPWTF